MYGRTDVETDKQIVSQFDLELLALSNFVINLKLFPHTTNALNATPKYAQVFNGGLTHTNTNAHTYTHAFSHILQRF